MANNAPVNDSVPEFCPNCQCLHVRFWAKKSGLNVYACPECGLGYRYPLPSDDALHQLYNKELFTSPGRKEYYIDDRASALINACRMLKIVQKHHRKPGYLLDLGCGFGHFLSVARDRGKYDVIGYEVSEFAAQTAKEMYNLDVRVSSVQHSSIQGRFDVITLWDVIEHLRDPFSILSRLPDILADDGIVAFSTGDRSSFSARIFGKHWSLLNPVQHLYYFTIPSLDLALNRAGLRIRAVYRPGRWYPLRYIGQKLKENFSFLSRAGSAIQRLSPEKFRIPINLRDIVVVVAGKKPAD